MGNETKKEEFSCQKKINQSIIKGKKLKYTTAAAAHH